MHVLTLNATLKEGESYINEWMRLKFPMQERYDVILGMIDNNHCHECSIEVTKDSVNIVLKFLERDDLISFLVNNPQAKINNSRMKTSRMSIVEE